MDAQTPVSPPKRKNAPGLHGQDDPNKVPRITDPPGDLNNEKKRWLIIGICLHTIISPLLRKYVNPIINNLYKSLVSSESIDTQGYHTHLKRYPETNKYLLNYESTNDNRKVPKIKINNVWKCDFRKYDYKVTSHVGLSKLFLQPNMAQYSAIDESCDSSALLSMVINISSFPQAVQTAADKIRLEIRNSWAHCDFRNWTGEKYRNCLHIMGQFVKDISLSDTDRKRSLEELNTWNTYGQNYFLSETKRDVNITDAIRQQTHVLIEYVQHGLTETDNQIMEVKKELQDLESGLHERIKKLEDKTEKQDNKIQQLTHATEEIIRKQVEDPNPKFIRDLQDRPRDNEIRIVLLGRTGAGKSATGNSLLCQKYFLSLFSGSSVTANCKRGESERKGKKVVIVDTPGLFDTKAGNETITKEIVKCIAMTSPGPHAIVLVVSAGRFTPEDQNTVEHFKYHFGEGLFHHMIVLFTMKDELDKHNQSIDQHVETVPNYLKTILSQCGNRYIAFNNDHVGQSNTEQIDDFFEIVEKMCIENGGSCYTNEQYQEVEAELQRRMQMEKEALENQMEKEKETVRNEVEDKFNQKLEKEMEEKRKLKDILKSNIIKSEDEKVKLEKQIKEATEKHDQMLKKREKELEEKIQKTEDEFKQKMTENVLRTNQRNNVENDTGRLLMDIAGGVYSFFKLWFPK